MPDPSPHEANERLTGVELMLYEHFRYLACPSPVDPVDTDDCASMAVEVIRFLTEKGTIGSDQAAAFQAGREAAARNIQEETATLCMDGVGRHLVETCVEIARGEVPPHGQ